MDPDTPRRARPLAKILLAGVALAIAGAAAAYAVLVLSTINAPAPVGLGSPGTSPGSLSPRTPNPSAQLACAGSFEPAASFGPGPEGPWVVAGDGTGGFVGYRAPEILAFEFVRAPNDAVARTDAVEGELEIEGTRLATATITARVQQLRSDIDVRDSHLAEFLGLREHPDATFTLTEPIELGEPEQGRIVEVAATGDLTIVEATRPVTFPLQARWNGDTIEVAGSLVIRRADFGMDVPQLLGFRVAEEITLELSLVFVRPGQTGCEAPAASARPSEGPVAGASPSAGPPAAATLDRLPGDWGELAFMALTQAPGPGAVPAELFLLRPGDTQPTMLTDTGFLEDEPAWSADGRRLAYARYPPEAPPQLWLAAADGSDQRQLVPGSLRSPDWSPDGRFVLAIPGEDTRTALILIDVEAGTARQLVADPGAEDAPDWSPDGRSIALGLLATGANDEDIYLVDADGTNLRRLTSDPAYEYQPAWSPDGRELAFVRGGDLWVMAADGTDERRLTTGLTVDTPTWSLDGRRLAFVIAGTGSMNEGPQRQSLWFVDADGSDLSTMTFDLWQVAHPAWRP